VTLRLGLADEAQWALTEEIVQSIIDICRQTGIETARVRGPHDEAQVDATLYIGYPRRYQRLLGQPKSSRRVSWYGESLPISPPSRWQLAQSRLPMRTLGDRLYRVLGPLTGGAGRERIAAWREQAVISNELTRNVRELSELRRRALIDELVVSTPNRAAGAAFAGWQARVAHFGYHPTLAGPLRDPAEPRDIDVLVLGHVVDSLVRRKRLLAEVLPRLPHGLRVETVTGGLFGMARHELLGRTKLVLHLHRMPHSFAAIRYVLATAAGAALVSEPTDDDWVNDRQRYVTEAEPDVMADTITELLGDEDQRRRLVANGQQLLSTDLLMSTALSRVLELEPSQEERVGETKVDATHAGATAG
jgi:hypothetical protein